MTQKTYIVEGRQFRTEADYKYALHDQKIIEKLRVRAASLNQKELLQFKDELKSGKYRFLTILGQDYLDEIDEMLKHFEKTSVGKKTAGKAIVRTTKVDKTTENKKNIPDAFVEEELKKQEKKRKLLVLLCSGIAVVCLGYFAIYSYFDYKTDKSYELLSELKEQPLISQKPQTPVIHYTEETTSQPREVLDEYKNLLNKNKKLIGWLKIDDTNIDYPVMQTVDNEYYLDHNLNQEYDKNGSIFMDKDCNVVTPSTNYILYGHHMKSGQMFGKLHLYGDEEYYKEHSYIHFDTIYEKGTYQVMYVFRSRVYSEEEIVFKYYQFIDAISKQEFDSNMQEMAAMSLYDTGVTAEYGDQLLTLSTCDYQEKDGRFVVVAKRVAKE